MEASCRSISAREESSPPRRAALLELPAELREQIWMRAVTVWTVRPEDGVATVVLENMPIRMDRFNRPQPPGITETCRSVRAESLHLYYQLNIFEFWRPLACFFDWSNSTLVGWLAGLGPEKVGWLNGVVLLYKEEDELENDIEEALRELGFAIKEGLIHNKRELSELEMCSEQLCLPRHFGKKRSFGRRRARGP